MCWSKFLEENLVCIDSQVLLWSQGVQMVLLVQALPASILFNKYLYLNIQLKLAVSVQEPHFTFSPLGPADPSGPTGPGAPCLRKPNKFFHSEKP